MMPEIEEPNHQNLIQPIRTELELDVRGINKNTGSGGDTGGGDSFRQFSDEEKVSEVESKGSVSASEISANFASYDRGKTMSTITPSNPFLNDFILG